MSEYRVPALRIRQGEERQLYSLAIEGKQISKIAAISRIRRGEENLVGYQRQKYVTIFAKFSAILRVKTR